MKPDSTRARTILWSIVILLASPVTGCAESTQTVTEPTAEQWTVASTSEIDVISAQADAGPESSDQSQDGDGEESLDVDSASMYDELDVLTAILEDNGEHRDIPAEGSDLTLGGSPDRSSAVAIVKGLEDAGVALDGITVSVLPISGMKASLLVMEVSDEYVETALPAGDEGNDITETLLAMPEIESASIAEVVTIYRGEDEIGAFTMTFTVSVEDLRQVYESGGELGDELLVQLERRR